MNKLETFISKHMGKIIISMLIAAAGFWITFGYVAFHFIGKFW